MLNKKSVFTIAIILLSVITTITTECRRHRGSSFGYGFLGGLVGSSVSNLFRGYQQGPVVIQKETIIVKERPQVRQYKTFTYTTHQCPNCQN